MDRPPPASASGGAAGPPSAPWWLTSSLQALLALGLVWWVFPEVPAPVMSALFMLWSFRCWSVQAVGGARVWGGQEADDKKAA